MRCGCKIMIIIFLTTLVVSALFTVLNIQDSPLTQQPFRALIGLKNTKRPYFNPSESTSPSPSPLPTLPFTARAPLHHVHRRHPKVYFPPSETEDDRTRKRVLVAVFVSAGGVTLIICLLIGLFVGCRKFRKTKVISNNVNKVISESIPHNFYLESPGTVLDPSPVCVPKIDSYDNDASFTSQNIHLNNYEGHVKRLSSSENLDDSSDVVASFQSLKFDEEGEQVFFGSPIGEELMDVESNSSDAESFHSVCNSHHSSFSRRISDASVGCDLLMSTSSRPSPPPPPPPPMPILYSSSSTTKMLKTFSSSTKPVFSLRSNPTAISLPSQTLSSQPPFTKGNPAPPPTLSLPPPFTKRNPPPPQTLSLPPSFTKGNPPPPPPLFQSTPMGKHGTPLPKLKPLHWDKVRATTDRSMVWDKLRSSSFEFDEDVIESLFGYNLHNCNDQDLKSKSPSPNQHVLEPKRLQNVTILLKALNATTEQVCHALIEGNGLNIQQLEVLVKMEPTKEEAAKLTTSKSKLDPAETFVASLLDIPYAFSRIEALLYRETFKDELTHLRKTFSILEEACKELRSSRLFLKLLEAVLKTGNRMNIGTIRGGAKAFKLDALLKLADVKGTDGKTTLLHFVVQELVRSEGIRVSESIIGKINEKTKKRYIKDKDKDEDYRNMGLELVAGLSTELCNVKKTATIDFDVIAGSVSNLSQGMDKLQTLVNKDLLMEEQTCSFVEIMKSFLYYAKKHMEELEEDEQRVLELVKEISEYFHGDMSKDDVNPLQIFVIIRDFLAMLDLVCRELRRSKGFGHPNTFASFQ
uniref:formin-like protein 11 n=1 Tax=Erigeron canadensis TaxID=72917 RepID=UPI001CB9ADDA|nr:formin-like protein 11 [Erigeron canadensis]